MYHCIMNTLKNKFEKKELGKFKDSKGKALDVTFT